MRELAKSDAEKIELKKRLDTVSKDSQESYLAQAEASAILAEDGDKNAEKEVRDWLQEEENLL